MRLAHEAAQTECVTVAVRRLPKPGEGENLLDHIDQDKIKSLYSNPMKCRTARIWWSWMRFIM